MMKKINNIRKTVSILALAVVGTVSAQIGVETQTIRGSGILDFPVGVNKGIIIPILNSSVNPSPSPGTIRMYNKMIQGITNSGVLNFSDVGDTSVVSFNTSTPRPVGGNYLIIGASSSPVAGGALVLESADKALILPHVANVENMPSPYPGTICYDVKSKTLALFDGKVWNFWK
jgi:hypothetical protein